MPFQLSFRWVKGCQARSVQGENGVYVDALFEMDRSTEQKVCFIFESDDAIKAAKFVQSLNEVLGPISKPRDTSEYDSHRRTASNR